MSNPTLTVSVLVNANTDKTWAYYTGPEHIVQWNFADKSWCCPSAENDLRVGGKYSARMEAKDGSVGFDFVAVYDEVVIGEHFTYTMSDGRRVTTRLESVGSQTNVTTVFEMENQHPIEMQQAGWQAILDNFQKYVEMISQTFYHGTKADLPIGGLIEIGFRSNYGQQTPAKYVYLSATLEAATWGAELAVGEGNGRIYKVEPTGAIEDDPNLTDKKFPGNPTKSYRTKQPLCVVGEVTDWQGHSAEQLQAMKDHLERLKEQGINAIED